MRGSVSLHNKASRCSFHASGMGKGRSAVSLSDWSGCSYAARSGRVRGRIRETVFIISIPLHPFFMRVIERVVELPRTHLGLASPFPIQEKPQPVEWRGIADYSLRCPRWLAL